MKKNIELIKNRSDIGAGTRGSDLGVDALEIAAINTGSDFFQRYPYVDVETRNHSIYEKDKHPYARHIEQIYLQCQEVCSEVEKSLMKECFPLVFSGDHSSALGTLSGIKAAFPEKTLGVVWIDAHADIHSPYTTPSGNMHGMPLAAALHEDNLECQINEVDHLTQKYWEKLKHIGTASPKILPEHLIYFGVRDTEDAEKLVMARLNIRNFGVEEVRQRGISTCSVEALERLKNCDIVYISLDVDGLDSALIADGTGTPVPNGFVPDEVIRLLQDLLMDSKVVCLELVEINPLLDKLGNKTAEVAFDILEHIIPTVESVKPQLDPN